VTYWQFHLVFTLPLLAFMLWLNRKNQQAQNSTHRWGTLILVLLAVIYTTPWDSYLIQQNIWNYQPENILFTIYYIPIEEYFFFIIQTIIACFFCAYLMNRKGLKQSQVPMSVSPRHIFYFLLFNLGLMTLWWFTPQKESLRYIQLIFYWAMPIIFLQWSLGGSLLLRHWKLILSAIAILTTYFWFADSVAIYMEIWGFPSETITQTQLFGILPIEEALFFLLTHVMVVQGYFLFTQVDLKQMTFQLKERH
jgi:lycopene beta-cyclase